MSDTAVPKPHVPRKKLEPAVFNEVEVAQNELKKNSEKRPFALQPHLTARPFKGHPGLEDLKKHLGKKK